MSKNQRSRKDFDPRFSATDSNGVPYGDRLKRAREAIAKSAEEVAALSGIPVPAYYDLEAFEGELNMTISLGKLSKLASVLETPTRFLFDNKREESLALSA